MFGHETRRERPKSRISRGSLKKTKRRLGGFGRRFSHKSRHAIKSLKNEELAHAKRQKQLDY
jgi:hypothetical protein